MDSCEIVHTVRLSQGSHIRIVGVGKMVFSSLNLRADYKNDERIIINDNNM